MVTFSKLSSPNFVISKSHLGDIKPIISSPTFIAGSILSSLIAIYIGKIWMSYGYFKRLGLKTPKYSFLYGNLKDIASKGYSSCYQEWTKELGHTYGFYDGHMPILVTSDLELIQEIFIKKFSYFSPRKMSPHISSDNDPSLDLFTSGGEKWKRYRTIMNLTFTWTKIKELIPLIQMCSERFFEVLDKSPGEAVTVSDYFDRLTMDTIFNCAFGIDIDPQKNVNNVFLTAGINHFKERARLPFTYKLMYLFHEFKGFINAISRNMNLVLGSISSKMVPSIYILYANINQVLKERLAKQILIDSCKDEYSDKSKLDGHVEFKEMRIDKNLAPKEIINHLVLFLLTGFETTSSALSYCIYEMTQHHSEMKKLQAEVDEFFPPNSDFEPNLEKIQNMTYLDMFFKEVLRMHPVANGAITRRCVEPISIKNINFTRNLVITIDVLSLHYSEEYWENPYEFNPKRFAPENNINPLVYMPFGVGPRTCIGLRFAQLEVKLMMIKLLRKYDVLATSSAPQKMEYSEGIVRRPKHGVSAVFKPRFFQ